MLMISTLYNVVRSIYEWLITFLSSLIFRRKHRLPIILQMYRNKLLLLLVLTILVVVYVEIKYVNLVTTAIGRLFENESRASPGKTVLDVPNHINVHYVVRAFLRTVESFQMDVVILQPSMLLLFLDKADVHLLEKRNVTPFTNEKNNVFTFGIVGRRNVTKMVDFIKEKDFVYGQGFVEDSPWNTEHHFFVHSDVMIHLVCLKKRTNFYYSSAIEQMPSVLQNRFGVEDLLFGKYPTALERFSVENVFVSSMNFPIPQPLLSFVAYLKWSRFLDCNHTAKEMYFRENASPNNKQLESLFLTVIPHLKTIFDGLVAPFWLVSGTLLGWYRQCGIIQHTSDVDVAAYIRYDSDLIYSKIHSHPRIKLLHSYGYPEKAFEICVSDGYKRVDIFFMHEEANFNWYAIHVKSKSYFQLVYSKYSLCSAELLGLKILVPCTPEVTITEEYGSDWIHPVTEWRYDNSSKNSGQKFTWSKDEEEKIVS